MLLPYNVDRATRSTPIITYTLISLNVVCFLFSVLVSNLNLAADKQQAQVEIETLLKNDPSYQSLFRAPEFAQPPGAIPTAPQQVIPSQVVPAQVQPPDSSIPASGAPASPPHFVDSSGEELSPEDVAQYRQEYALMLASKDTKTPDGYRRVWQIEHMNDAIVLEPHYSVLNSLAYRINNPSPLARFLSMFSAMFLHGSIDHILGNMLFLWVFGRATEEFLGRNLFVSVYFLSGVGATLLDHLITSLFSPDAIGIPNLGASGAIAGVLGLFAVRFYRTKVRIFYVLPTASWIFLLAFLLSFMFGVLLLRDYGAASVVGVLGGIAAVFVVGRNWAWGAFRAASVQVIGVWVVLFNLAPAILKMVTGGVGGVAYWAHIGGFALGAVYAALIGGVEEGKSEYQIEDAQTALVTLGSDDALAQAGRILARDPHSPQGHEVMARAYDRRKNYESAAMHYEKAIEAAWKSDDRDTAARLYVISREHHPNLPLRPALLLNLSSHYMQNTMWTDAAGTFVRLIEEHPTSPEAEIALLRSAGLWMRQFRDPAEAARQLEIFVERYPMSTFLPQAQDALGAARRAAT